MVAMWCWDQQRALCQECDSEPECTLSANDCEPNDCDCGDWSDDQCPDWISPWPIFANLSGAGNGYDDNVDVCLGCETPCLADHDGDDQISGTAVTFDVDAEDYDALWNFDPNHPDPNCVSFTAGPASCYYWGESGMFDRFTYDWDIRGLAKKIPGCEDCCGRMQLFVRGHGEIAVNVMVDDVCGHADDEPVELEVKFWADCVLPVMDEVSIACPAEGEFAIASASHMRPVEWILEDNEENCKLECLAPADGKYRVKIWAGTQTGNGKVRVIAADCLFPECFDERELRLGCQGCSGDGCGAGSPLPEVGSLSFGLRLGKLADGKSAGTLGVYATYGAPRLSVPSALRYTLREGVQRWDDPSSEDFELLAPEVLAHVVDGTPDDYKYRVDFFTRAQVDSSGSGPWGLLDPNDAPFVSYEFESSGPENHYSTLTITKKVPNAEDVKYVYSYSEVEANYDYTWALSTIQGSTTIRTETADWDYDHSDTWTLKRRIEQDGGFYLITEDTYKSSAWGRELVSRAVDPNSVNLVTQYGSYGEGDNPGRLRYSIAPDGSWRYFEYDAMGRTVRLYDPWEDSTFDPEGGAPSAATSRVTEFEYANDPNSADPNDVRPAAVEVYVESTLVSRTEYDYTPSGGNDRVIEKRCIDPSNCAAGALETVTTYVGTDHDKLLSVVFPDDRQDSYSYDDGGFVDTGNPDAAYFDTNGSGYERTTIKHGTTTSPDGVANKSTWEKIVTNAAGRRVLQETYVYTGSGTPRVGWTLTRYDERGRVKEVHRSDGTKVETNYDDENCCGAGDEVIDAHGIQTTFVRDLLGRVTQSTKESNGSDSDIVTSTDYTVSGGARVVTTTVSAGTLSLETVETYDLAGRLISSVDPAGLETTYDYGNGTGGGRQVTVTRPGGATETTDYYRDGQIKSVTGTGVVHQYYDYDKASGQLSTQVFTGSAGASSPRWSETVYDALGRVVIEKRPAFMTSGTDTIGTVNTYDNANGGRLVQTGLYDDPNDPDTLLTAATVYEYDVLGNLERSGLDLNGGGDGDLDNASDDRISESITTFVLIGSDYWRKTVSKVYPSSGGGTAKTVGKQYQRLTGFGTNEIAETQSEDIFGNTTTVTTTLDRSTAEVTVTTEYFATANTAVQVTRNGLLQSVKGLDQLTTTFGYDALGRQTTVTDSRGNATTTHYDSAGRVESVEDEEGNDTIYTYCDGQSSNAGRIQSVKNAQDKYTYYDYDDLGNITHVWGDVPQPVRFAFDGYGQRTELRTFRGEPGGGATWHDGTWPINYEPYGDVTTWTFDPATGLLTNKEYADENGTDYEYTKDGRISQRTWQRLDGSSNRIYTTYAYYNASAPADGALGELETISYSDATPDVTFTYTRLGQPASIADALGTRSFTYNSNLQRIKETFGASGPLSGKVITTDFEDTVSYQPPGAQFPQLFKFDRLEAVEVGTSGDSDAYYRAAYDYSGDSGRMTKVTAGPGLPAGGVQYTYWTGTGGAAAPLVQKIEYKDSSSTLGTVDFAYETNRDLIQSVTNYWGGTDPGDIVSKYAYVNDSLARRTSVVRTGSAFNESGGASPAHADVWSYNDRNELVESERFNDTTAPFDQNNVAGLDREFTYDPIGNRKSYVEGTAATQYYCANELNQYDTIDDDSSDCPPGSPDESLSYDLDGNLTACNNTAEIAPGAPVRQVALTWDAENRLTSVAPVSQPVSGDQKVEFEYDYMGRRVSKKVSSYDGSTWSVSAHRRFIYHGWLQLLELDALDSNAVETKWTWGLDIAGQRGNPTSIGSAAGIGGLLACYDADASDSFAFFYDANGNAGQLVDTSDGSTAARYEYDAYGNVTFTAGAYASENKIRFSTKYWDDETGLGYWGYRYYEPRTGRWTSRDPIGERGGTHTTGYVLNSPGDWIDLLGQQASDTSSSGCCGPDITHQMHRLRRTLVREFTALPPRRQMAVCRSMTTGDGWDIGDLHLWGFGGTKMSRFDAYSRAGCGTGACKGTIKFNGHCYPAGQVNYWLFGFANRLCAESLARWTVKRTVKIDSSSVVLLADLDGRPISDTYFSCKNAAARAGDYLAYKHPFSKSQRACKTAWILAGCEGAHVPESCARSDCGMGCCTLDYRDSLGAHLGDQENNLEFGSLPWVPVNVWY